MIHYWSKKNKYLGIMAGWHHWLDGRESEWTPGAGDGQGGLACCDSWGRKELDMTERLNWTEEGQKTCMQKSARHWWKMTQRDISCPWIRRINIVKLTILPEAVSDSMQSLRLPMAFFIELEQKISQFVWKHKRSQIAKAILREENGAGGINLSDLDYTTKL